MDVVFENTQINHTMGADSKRVKLTTKQRLFLGMGFFFVCTILPLSLGVYNTTHQAKIDEIMRVENNASDTIEHITNETIQADANLAKNPCDYTYDLGQGIFLNICTPGTDIIIDIRKFLSTGATIKGIGLSYDNYKALVLNWPAIQTDIHTAYDSLKN